MGLVDDGYDDGTWRESVEKWKRMEKGLDWQRGCYYLDGRRVIWKVVDECVRMIILDQLHGVYDTWLPFPKIRKPTVRPIPKRTMLL